MFMEFTPKDWFMMRIGLIFQVGDPDPEDPWVRAYLDEQQLVPRHRAQEERNGIPCEVLYFGQCYLGRHLHTLQSLYQKGLERSLLVDKLRDLRPLRGEGSIDWPLELDDPSFEAVLPTLAEALHEQVTFATDSEGYLTLTLDPTLVTAELMRLLATSPRVPTLSS
jgi:hypothetical protein